MLGFQVIAAYNKIINMKAQKTVWDSSDNRDKNYKFFDAKFLSGLFCFVLTNFLSQMQYQWNCPFFFTIISH